MQCTILKIHLINLFILQNTRTVTNKNKVLILWENDKSKETQNILACAGDYHRERENPATPRVLSDSDFCDLHHFGAFASNRSICKPTRLSNSLCNPDTFSYIWLIDFFSLINFSCGLTHGLDYSIICFSLLSNFFRY